MLTDFDKKLLREMQHDIPRASRPYQLIADKLGTTEDFVLSRLTELREAGYIRRMGAFLDSAALGLKGTLIALKVNQQKLAEVAEYINSLDEVTHNYEREGEYNLWFTLQTTDEAAKAAFLARIKALDGVGAIMDLPVEKKYKIKVELPIG